jgi:hypothetical protein
VTDDIDGLDRAIAEAKPREAASRRAYETLDQARQRVRDAIAIKSRVESLEMRRTQLPSFRPAKRPRDQIAIGVGHVVGGGFAQEVQAILDAWHFPGPPVVVFDDKTHDILIDGKDRQSNGKGVRALMNAAFKLAVLSYCRRLDLPHPGIVVLDSPLVTYRDPHVSKHGGLSEDEEELKRSGVKDGFYEYLLQHAVRAQFIVIENDPPPFDVEDRANVIVFAGRGGEGVREGLF